MLLIFTRLKSIILPLIIALVIGQEENYPNFEVENLNPIENTILKHIEYTPGFHLENSESCPNASTALKADHQLFPNPSLTYAVGTSVGNTLSDVGLSSTKYPITAGSGVTYNGHSLTFDGTSNAWVSFGNAVSFGGEAFSISVRAKYTFATCCARIFDFQASEGHTAGVLLHNSDRNLVLYLFGSENHNIGTSTSNQFFHFMLTCTPPNTCRVYFNGVLVNTYTVGTITTQIFSHVAGLGKSAYSHDAYFSGEVADFRLFNRALTSDEVTAIYTGNECATSSCSAGNYYSTTSSSCVACPVNSTSNAGAYTCTCAANFYQTGYGVGLVCTACPANGTSTDGAYTCNCVANFYQTGYGVSLVCTACPSSSISNAGAISCTCNTGYVLYGSGNNMMCVPATCPIASTALKADHQLFPNPSLAYAVGASVDNTLSDVGLSSTKYPITAGSGVTYNGHSLTFDGTSNAWVSFGNAVSFGGEAFSISVRAKYTFATCCARIFDFQASEGHTAGVLLHNSDRNLVLYLFGSENLNIGTSTSNQFFHFMLTCTPPNTCRVYFNGVLVNTYTVGTITTQIFSHVAGLGKSAYLSDAYFSGEVADFRLFNRALTSDEVTAIYIGNECATSSCSAGNYFSTTSSSCVACPAFSTSNAGAYTCTCRNGYTSSGYGVGLTCVFSSFNTCPNASTSLKADHQLFPNPSLTYAVGASVDNTLSDVGLSSTKYPITAGSGVRYNGHSLTFDGTSNAWVSFGNAVSFGGEAFSISVRAKYTSFATSCPRIFDFQPLVNSGAGVLLASCSNAGTLVFNAFNGGNKYPSTPWRLNQFDHVVFTCTPPNTCKFYFNGAIENTYTVGTLTTQTYSYVAGLGKASYADAYLSGEIADFRLFNRALTSDEVTAIYTGNECATSSCNAGSYFSTTSSSCVACPAFSTSTAGAYTCTCRNGYTPSGYGVGLVCMVSPKKNKIHKAFLFMDL